MQKMLQILKNHLEQGQDLVLVTVIAASGATPRGAGARMLVDSEGRLYGTIGGGAVEYRFLQIAGKVLEEKSSYGHDFSLTKDDVQNLGMICGGAVTVYFHYIPAGDPGTIALAQEAEGRFSLDQDLWLVSDIAAGGALSLADRSNPALAPHLTRHSHRIQENGKDLYIEQIHSAGKVYIFGGGHVAQELVPVLAHVVIDIGDSKSTVVEDMDSLTEQTGIPFVHVDATVATAPEAYRLLGQLLGREEKAEQLATWCENTYSELTKVMEQVDADGARKSMLYCLGDKGTNVIAEGSFHAETVNMMSRNLAVLEDVVSNGLGNEVDLEQILSWDPDVIVFAPDSCYEDVGTSAQWQGVRAIAEGNYYKTPYGPYGWLSSPPSVQRYLGMLWLGALLYPEYIQYDLQEAVTEYYKLFYSCELTEEAYQHLMANAMPET